MKFRLMRRLLPLLAAGAALLFSTQAMALSISLVAANDAITTGETTQVDIVLSDLGSAVGGFDIQFAFSATDFSVTNLTAGDSLGNPLLFEAFVNSVVAGGVGTLTELSLLSTAALAALQSDALNLNADLVLGSFDLTLLVDELSAITLIKTDIAAASGEALVTDETTGLWEPVDPSDPGTAVPEPGAAVLFAVGAVLVSAHTQRKSRL
jgi:hypothetical protein